MTIRLALPLTALVLAAVAGAALLPTQSGEAPPAVQPVAAAPVASTPPSPAAASGVSPAVRAYVDAVNAEDLDALVQAFAPNAVIVDVRRQIAGQDAIRSWADREVVGGSLRVIEVVEDRPDGQLLLVQWAPGGSGGWRAHYDFTVSGGRLTAADLQYA